MKIGGKLINNDTIVNIGLQLADACWNTYASSQYVWTSESEFLLKFGDVPGPGSGLKALRSFLRTVTSQAATHSTPVTLNSMLSMDFTSPMESISSAPRY